MSTSRALTIGLVALAIVVGACGSSAQGTVEGVFYGLGSRVVKTHNGGVPSPGTIRVGGPEGIYLATST